MARTNLKTWVHAGERHEVPVYDGEYYGEPKPDDVGLPGLWCAGCGAWAMPHDWAAHQQHKPCHCGCHNDLLRPVFHHDSGTCGPYPKRGRSQAGGGASSGRTRVASKS
jgi:hypothetical protein